MYVEEREKNKRVQAFVPQRRRKGHNVWSIQFGVIDFIFT